MKQITLRQLSETIEKIMRAKRMTAKELAQKAGMSYSSLIPILNGSRECGISKLIAIANALGCTTDALLSGLINADNADDLAILTAGEQASPKYLAVFISIIKVSYCTLYDLKSGNTANAVLPFPLRCGEGADVFLDHIATATNKLAKDLNLDISLKQVGVFASVQQYGRSTARKKIQLKGDQLFAKFLMESDAISNHNAFIANDNGICISINDGSVLTYSLDKGKTIVRMQGYGFPISDVAGNFWLGCEAIKHVIAVKEKREPSSILSDHILALYNDDIDLLSEATMENPGESYLKASAIVKELMNQNSKPYELVKRSADLLHAYVRIVDDRAKKHLPIFIAGELAHIYEQFFEPRRLIETKKRRNQILFEYGLSKLKNSFTKTKNR